MRIIEWLLNKLLTNILEYSWNFDFSFWFLFYEFQNKFLAYRYKKFQLYKRTGDFVIISYTCLILKDNLTFYLLLFSHLYNILPQQ